MKFVAYAILLTMEYCVVKMGFIVVEALIIKGTAEFLGYLMLLALAIFGISLWRYGVRQING